MCRNSNFVLVLPVKTPSKVGYFTKIAEMFSTTRSAQRVKYKISKISLSRTWCKSLILNKELRPNHLWPLQKKAGNGSLFWNGVGLPPLHKERNTDNQNQIIQMVSPFKNSASKFDFALLTEIQSVFKGFTDCTTLMFISSQIFPKNQFSKLDFMLNLPFQRSNWLSQEKIDFSGN